MNTPRTQAAWTLLLTVLAALPAPAAGAAPPAPAAERIAALVAQLGDRSADVRDAAVTDLTRIGRPARDALVAASRAQVGPAQRRRLARLLLRQLPLTDAADAAPLRTLLARYQNAPADQRPRMAQPWIAGSDPTALAAFARVASEEPDENVLWTIVAALGPDDRERLAATGALAALEPDSPPQLYLAGFLEKDATRGLALFERCLAETPIVPPAAYPAIARVGNALAAGARGAHDARRELEIRRSVALLVPARDNDRLSAAAEAYLEARLRLRTAEGLDDDLQTLGIPRTDPAVRLVDALLRLPTTLPAAPLSARDVPASVWETVDAMGIDEVLPALDLLTRGGAPGAVDAITHRMLSQLANNRDPNVEVRRLQVYMARYNAARAGHDRTAAGEALRGMLEKVPPDALVTRREADGTLVQMPMSSLFAEMHIAQLRRAMRDDDRAAIDASLDGLALVSIYDSTLAIDAIYLFEQCGRLKEADEVFAEYLAEAYERLDAAPGSASAMNAVAWFSARTGRNLEAAYRLAGEAIRRSPDSAAMLDTYAEAAFRAGHAREAADAERRALATQPGDAFMTGQLRRFTTPPQPGDAERALPSESWEAEEREQ